jgi:predicted dehydrogenase
VGAVSQTITAQGGMAVILTSLKAGGWQERVSLHGDNLTIEVDAFRQMKVKKGDREEIFGNDRPGKWISELKERGFYGLVAHFLDCIQTRQEALTSGKDACKTHELIDELVKGAGENPARESENWDNVQRWGGKKEPYFKS